MYIDSHCHLDMILEQNHDETIENIILGSKENQIQQMLCISVNTIRWQAMYDLCRPYFDQILLTAGIHPCYVEEDQDFDLLKKQAKESKVIAIGETGLDFFYGKDDAKSLQKESFAKHIDLAIQVQKPLIVHTRDARFETIDILKAEQADRCLGVMHCFTEDIDMARKAIDLGFYISFSGIVTFKNAEKLRDVAKYVPLDRILIETDSPYLAPVPYRGKINYPSYVRFVAEQVAMLKNVSVDMLNKNIQYNFNQLFNTSVGQSI